MYYVLEISILLFYELKQVLELSIIHKEMFSFIEQGEKRRILVFQCLQEFFVSV